MRHPLPIDRVSVLLAAPDAGLDAAEVSARRERFGRNDIVEDVRRPFAELARQTAGDPMIWFLVGTSLLYAFLGQIAEAITLAGSILPLVGMDVYLHRRTQASTQGLRGLLADTARVVRGGAEATVMASEVVAGDLAIVSTGEPFPADGVVVAGHELTADESALTGEAYPVAKRPLAAAPAQAAAGEVMIDGDHWGFAGTRLLTGRASVRVVAVGRDTLYGGIVRLAAGGDCERTPLQQLIDRLVHGLLVAAAALCLVLAAVRLAQGFGWADALVSAATLAVAALPEEFPVVLAVFLGAGVYRLARRQALVSRAVAVENIGRVSQLCSDKTGTITEGRLRVVRVVPAGDRGEAHALAIAAIASRLETGDPLDRAILDAAGGPPPCERLATFPFTEDRRRETAIVRREGEVIACTKGAPETVLELCGGGPHGAWSARVAELAGLGHKVIACASRALPAGAPPVEPDGDLTMDGLIAIADPIRSGVPDAVAWCHAAGVRILMVTGDHPATARAVAREMGLAEVPEVRSGDDLAGGADLGAVLRGAHVVARALPAQKVAIVRALQAAGEVVAVTGDGVNDVPALQAADVGVAMGQRGARSAREVSSIVLLDDNFRSIVAAIQEGRALFENLQLAFLYLLMIHVPFVLTATFVPLAGYPVLFLPIHVVWLEAIIHPTAMLVFQGSSAGDRPPSPRARGRDAHLFTRAEWALIALAGLLGSAGVALAFQRGMADGDVARGRAMAMVALTLTSAALTAGLSRLASRASRVVVGTSAAATIVLVQVPALSQLLALTPLTAREWMLPVGCATVALVPAVLAGRSRR